MTIDATPAHRGQWHAVVHVLKGYESGLELDGGALAVDLRGMAGLAQALAGAMDGVEAGDDWAAAIWEADHGWWISSNYDLLHTEAAALVTTVRCPLLLISAGDDGSTGEPQGAARLSCGGRTSGIATLSSILEVRGCKGSASPQVYVFPHLPPHTCCCFSVAKVDCCSSSCAVTMTLRDSFNSFSASRLMTRRWRGAAGH